MLLVRHARAGDRGDWVGDDAHRPLDGKGASRRSVSRRGLADLGATRLVSSPALRCVQTFEPAAKRLGLPLEQRDELAEGGGPEELVTLLDDLGDSAPALSTHGDVIAEVVGWDAPCRKSSVWILEVDGGEIRPGTYLPPA